MKDQNTNAAIRNIENKYDLMLFRMGLTYLVDVGLQNMTDENVAEIIKQIKAEAEIEKDSIPVMTSEFRCKIVECAAELSKFSIWDLLKYVQTDIIID